MCEGYHERKEREWKEKQVELHLLRFVGASIHNIGAGFSKEAQGIEPKDLIELPLFDDRDTPEAISVDDAKERLKQAIKKDGRSWPQESD